jgi:hypothetical protein
MDDPGLPALAGTICGPRTTEQGGWLASMRGHYCRDDTVKQLTRSARSPGGRSRDQDLFWEFRGFRGFRDDEKGV